MGRCRPGSPSSSILSSSDTPSYSRHNSQKGDGWGREFGRRWRQSSLTASQLSVSDCSSVSTWRPESEPGSSVSAWSSLGTARQGCLSPPRDNCWHAAQSPGSTVSRATECEEEFQDRIPRGQHYDVEQYKSLSAHDFEQSILREEELARGTDDEKLLSSSRDRASSPHSCSLDSFSTFDNKEEFCPQPATAPKAKLGSDHKTVAREVDEELFKLLGNSKAENARLKLELKALESLLESAKFQLASTAEKATVDVTHYEKKHEEEDKVNKKIAEMEEELKLLSYSENLTDQALNQLKADNQRLMNEKTALLQVVQVMIYKLLVKYTVLFISVCSHLCCNTQKYHLRNVYCLS